MGSPTGSGHQQQQKTHDKQHHRHHFSLRQVIVGVSHPRSCHTDHQRDDSKGKDAAVPGLFHASSGLGQSLQRGQHVRDFGPPALQGLTFLPGAGLGLRLACQVARCTAHLDGVGRWIRRPGCSGGLSDRVCSLAWRNRQRQRKAEKERETEWRKRRSTWNRRNDWSGNGWSVSDEVSAEIHSHFPLLSLPLWLCLCTLPAGSLAAHCTLCWM